MSSEAVLRDEIFRRHARAPGDLGAAAGGVAAAGAWRWAVAAAAVWWRDWALASADEGRRTKDQGRKTAVVRHSSLVFRRRPTLDLRALAGVYSAVINAVSCRAALPPADLPGAAAVRVVGDCKL